MATGLRMTLETVNEKVILRLDGRLDAITSSLLEKKMNNLIEEHHYYLLLDFNRVDYLSSAGLRVLLSVSKQLKGKKGFLLLFALTDEVLEIVNLTGFDKVLSIFSSEKEALQFCVR